MSYQQKEINGLTPFPNKPAFYAYLSADDLNVTGAGTTYVLGTNLAFTTRFDQNSNISSLSPITITAHQTGLYWIYVAIGFRGLTIPGANLFDMAIIAPNNRPEYYLGISPTTTFLSITLGALVQMDATDTMTFSTRVSGQAGDTADIDGSNSQDSTYVTGFLVA